MQSLLENIFYWLFDAAVAQALLLTISCLYMMLDPQPARRVRVATATLAGVLLIAILALLPGFPRWSIAGLNVKAPERLPWLQATAVHATELPTNPSASIPLATSLPAAYFPWRELLAAAFLILAALFVLRLLAAAVTLARLKHRAQPHATIDSIPILRLPGLAAPLTFGTLKPVILTPPHMADDQAALAHELAHIHHHDGFIRTLQAWATVLAFYQPALWLLRSQLSRAQEHLADAAAARQSGGAVAYAESLLKLASTPEPPLALGMAGTRGQLLLRVQSLFTHGHRWHARPSRAFVTVATLLTLAAATLVGMLTFSAPTLAHDARAAELKGVHYLLHHQESNGGWLTRYGAAPTALVGRSLLQAGVQPNHRAIQRARTYLFNVQLSDGSFAGDAEPAYQTAVTLGFFAALNDPESHAAIARGQSFLRSIERQAAPVSDWYKSSKSPRRTLIASDERAPQAILDTYGSITYAQWKSLTYADIHPRDRWVQNAARWLETHWTVDFHPGTGSHDGLHFYLLAATRALRATESNHNPRPNWREDVTRLLVKQQQHNGAWTNQKSQRWLEDRPELVTAYALLTLQEARP